MDGVIILARLDSSRFPNKAITQVGGKKLIQHCIDEVKKINDVKIILATTARKVDLPLLEIAEENNLSCFRGEVNNVAKRVLDCIEYYNLDTFARVNGDSPLIRSGLIMQGFKLLHENSYDLVTNLIPRKYPYGISVEVINGYTFKNIYSEISQNESYSEHITSIFYQQNNRFKIGSISYPNESDHSKIHLTVDTPEDKLTMDRLFKLDPKIAEKSVEEIVKLYQKVSIN